MLLLLPLRLLHGCFGRFRAKQVCDGQHPDEDDAEGHEERREVAVARHLHQRGARGSARRRLSLAFAGPTRVALQLAISGAGERPQPCASEHNYESYGDSVVLRDSVLQPRRAAIGRQADLRRRPHTKVASVFEPRIWSSGGSGALTRCPREAGRRFEAIRQRAGLREIGRPAPVRSQGARGSLSVPELPLGTSFPRQSQGTLPRIPSRTVGHTPDQVLLPKAQQHAAVDRATPKNGSKSPTQ